MWSACVTAAVSDPALRHCTLLLQVTTTSSSGTKLGNVVLAGRWSSTRTTSGWPYNVSNLKTATSGTSLGTVSTKSSTNLTKTAGGGCTFTVTSATLSGYAMNPATTTSAKTTW
jgi:hypothetical protein